jgi:hypothetical protein
VAEPVKPFFLKRSGFFSFVGSDENKPTARNEFFIMRKSKKAKTMKGN